MYIFVLDILPTIICCICVLVYLFNCICATNTLEYNFDILDPTIYQWPNLSHQHFPGAQFASKNHYKWYSVHGPREDHHTVPPVIDRAILVEEDITYYSTLLCWEGSPLFAFVDALVIKYYLALIKLLSDSFELVHLRGLGACLKWPVSDWYSNQYYDALFSADAL